MKYALFVFNGDPMCFIHVLLNALDMKEKGNQAQIIMEGASVKLIPELNREEHPLHRLWSKAREAELLAGICKACSMKLGTFETAKELNLPILDEMSGHPSMAAWREKGFEVITF